MKSDFPLIWWLKKDFRLSDNPALTMALATRQNVIPIFIIEPSAVAPQTAPETSAFHVAAWLEAAKDLHKCLQQYGGELCILHGEVVELFEQIKRRTHFDTVVSHRETGTARTFERDIEFSKWCVANSVRWHQPAQQGVFRGRHDRNKRAQLWNAWMSSGPLVTPADNQLDRLKVPASVWELQDDVASKPLLSNLGMTMPADARRARQVVSATAAQATLNDFLFQRGIAYSGGISSPNSAFTAGSRLSVHLAWGTISGREVYAATMERMRQLKTSDDLNARRWRRSLSNFTARLHWRDHFTQRLETEPAMEFHALNRAYDDLPTSERTDDYLAAWCSGQTGFPLVDAVIRCAQVTGFANFRMRALITSVATHALRLKWSDVMWPMARWWADYEPGIHIAQIQMQAGVVGINTLRTYNPAKQIADQDPNAKFIKRWLPALELFSAEEIISHQESPLRGVCAPIVDWKSSTKAMRADYYALRGQPTTKRLASAVFIKHGSRKSPTTRRPKKATKKVDPNQMRFDFG